jgi:hypothetical protein
MLTESILAISEAELRLDRRLGLLAEHVIPNHGSVLKIDDPGSKCLPLKTVSKRTNHYIDSE